MELDKAFKLAVIFAREDLMNVTQLRSARVEYQREPETSLDYLSVWLVRAGGYQDLVCDHWTRTSSAHPRGWASGTNTTLTGWLRASTSS